MTREEVKEYSFKLEEKLYPFDKKSLAMIVDKIYNDFESRTCKNCIYNQDDGDLKYCYALNEYDMKYCDKFKPKE